ncbi:MAG: hypothetical protein ACD_11C00103G0023 [uncultured bacterium]|nr:MAG: hypothetical protein ACD_11C00103G0023 [uncultured bacterium]HBR71480.1 Asp-tRNA(Asn)/Glu-tRNA(Gln) amidotransferase subunit GatB [Candidatus Moranbacteria bacterium]
MTKYIPVIGMEIHIELKTESKMFCDCKNGMGLETEPNVNICPVCTGQPGTLPVPNRKAIEFVQLAGLALDCELNLKSKFDRKNYFYPDIPKGYQISQFDQPLCGKGNLEIYVSGDKEQMTKNIGITRIHLEEDTGKLVHPKGANYTLVDFNRAGVPLMELVTEPDIEDGTQARIFCQKLQQICRYLEISDADMEKGHMRCEVNLSLHKEGEEKLSGIKVEVKNINSFRFVEKAINFEIKRQTEILEKGEKVIQETRGWDSVKNQTVSQRKKESAHDYRYFPEPDIPPMEFTKEYVEELRLRLPELPDEKIKRFSEQYNLSKENISVLTSEKGLAEYFENVISEVSEKIKSKEISSLEEKVFALAANYIATELRKNMTENQQTIKDIKITPENYAEFVGIVADGKINSSAAQSVLKEMYATGGDPSRIIEEKNLMQTNDVSELDGLIDQVLETNAKSAEDYRAGKENAIKFLMGQVMAISKGKANPQVVMELLKEKLGK